MVYHNPVTSTKKLRKALEKRFQRDDLWVDVLGGGDDDDNYDDDFRRQVVDYDSDGPLSSDSLDDIDD